jgi:hypothetical protein
MERLVRLGAVSVFALVAGCASSIKHETSDGAPLRLSTTKVSAVEIYLDENAKKLHAENLKFNPQALRAMVQRALEAKGLVASDAPQRMAIEVTDIRVRSNFSAVMFGIFAGTDSVSGNVQLRDASGKPMAKYQVSASYGLGGFGGGQDEARMGWLYEEFAKLTVNGLTGETQK